MTKIRLPKSWDEVTLGQWREIEMVNTENEVSAFLDKVSILADCDPQTIREMKMSDYLELKEDVKFLSKPLEKKVNLKIEIDGKKYGMIPNMNFITAGEWLDAESWSKDPVSNIHNYCALLYRPITKEDGDIYEIEEHKVFGFEERANLFYDKIPITTIYGSVLFFSTLGLNCMEIIADYLQVETENLTVTKTTKKKTTQKATKKRKPKRSTKRGGGTI